MSTKSSEVVAKANKAISNGEIEMRLAGNSIDVEGAKALADAVAQSKSLQTLNLRRNRIGSEGAKALADAVAQSKSLQTLDLCGNNIGVEGAKALGDAVAQSTSLQTLDLRDNNISVEGAMALADAVAQSKSLQTLNLGYNSIGDEGAKALADAVAQSKSLQTLVLQRNSIGHEGAKALADAVAQSKSLQTLDLFENWIGHEGAKALADALAQSKSLQTLNLCGNNIGVEGAKALGDAVAQSTSLQTLNLGGTSIGREGAMALADAVAQSKSLQTLVFGSNNISAESAKTLADALAESKSLQTLDLHNSNIGPEGAKLLADAVAQSKSLQTLDLRRNIIGDEGAKALAGAVAQSKSLQKLFLRRNSIGDEGAKALADAVAQSKSLQTLDLQRNSIGHEGAKALADAVAQSKSLQTLDLDDNSIGEEGAKALADVWAQSKSLQTLYFGWIRFGKNSIISSDNKIGDETVKALADAVAQSKSLQTLDLHDNNISSEGAKALADAVAQSMSLQTLRLDSNMIGSYGAMALAVAVAKSKSLQTLDLGDNRIGVEGAKALADAVAQSKSLQTLDFSDNPIDAMVALAILRPDDARLILRDRRCDVAKEYSLRCREVGVDPVYDIPVEILEQGLQKLRLFLDDLVYGASAISELKVLMVGPQAVGKTSLANALTLKGDEGKLTGEGNERATISVEIRQLEFDAGEDGGTGKISLWDFGGQQEYYMTHSLFVSSRSLVMLVMDLGAYEDSAAYFDQTAGRWIRALAVQASRLRLVVVGTKADEVAEDAGPGAVMETMMTRVEALVASLGRSSDIMFAPHRAFVLSNKDTQQFDGVPQLYATLQDLACDPAQGTALRMPKSYVALRDTLFPYEVPATPTLTAMRRSVRDLSEVQERLGANDGEGARLAKDPEKLDLALKLLHDLGHVLWYGENPALSRYVFTDPAWLIEVMRSIYRHDLFKNPETGDKGAIYKLAESTGRGKSVKLKKLAADQRRLEQDCVLTEVLLGYLPIIHDSACGSLQGVRSQTWDQLTPEDRSMYLDLLMELDLLFELPVRTDRGVEEREFMIPLLLRKDFPRVYKRPTLARSLSRQVGGLSRRVPLSAGRSSISRGPGPDSSVLHWHCEFNTFLPEGLFFRLVARCYRLINYGPDVDESKFKGTVTVPGSESASQPAVVYFRLASARDPDGCGRIEVKAWSSKAHRHSLFDSFSVVLRRIDELLSGSGRALWWSTTQLLLDHDGEFGVRRGDLDKQDKGASDRESGDAQLQVRLRKVVADAVHAAYVPRRSLFWDEEDEKCHMVPRSLIAPAASLLMLVDPVVPTRDKGLWAFKYQTRTALKLMLETTEKTADQMVKEARRHLLGMLGLYGCTPSAAFEVKIADVFGLHPVDAGLAATLDGLIQLSQGDPPSVEEARRMVQAVAKLETRMRTARDVFLSHSWTVDSRDRDCLNHARVQDVADSLEEEFGLSCWFDTENLGGDKMSLRMAKGIDEAHVVLMCLSPSYMEKIQPDAERNYCRLEYSYAFVHKTTSVGSDTVIRVHMTDAVNDQGAPDLVEMKWVSLADDEFEWLDYLAERILAEIFPYDAAEERANLVKLYPAGARSADRL